MCGEQAQRRLGELTVGTYISFREASSLGQVPWNPGRLYTVQQINYSREVPGCVAPVKPHTPYFSLLVTSAGLCLAHPGPQERFASRRQKERLGEEHFYCWVNVMDGHKARTLVSAELTSRIYHSLVFGRLSASKSLSFFTYKTGSRDCTH